MLLAGLSAGEKGTCRDYFLIFVGDVKKDVKICGTIILIFWKGVIIIKQVVQIYIQQQIFEL